MYGLEQSRHLMPFTSDLTGIQVGNTQSSSSFSMDSFLVPPTPAASLPTTSTVFHQVSLRTTVGAATNQSHEIGFHSDVWDETSIPNLPSVSSTFSESGMLYQHGALWNYGDGVFDSHRSHLPQDDLQLGPRLPSEGVHAGLEPVVHPTPRRRLRNQRSILNRRTIMAQFTCPTETCLADFTTRGALESEFYSVSMPTDEANLSEDTSRVNTMIMCTYAITWGAGRHMLTRLPSGATGDNMAIRKLGAEIHLKKWMLEIKPTPDLDVVFVTMLDLICRHVSLHTFSSFPLTLRRLLHRKSSTTV